MFVLLPKLLWVFYQEIHTRLELIMSQVSLNTTRHVPGFLEISDLILEEYSHWF